jgi:HPr kinase/phosphorylase
MIHATAICIKGCGVVLAGKSGSGKSDLALRLIDRGADLICDDYVEIQQCEGILWLLPAPNIRGKIEVRGLGIAAMSTVDSAPLRLYVDLEMKPERHPDPWPSQNISGFLVPQLNLSAFEASAIIKIGLAVDMLICDNVFPRKVENKC